LLPVPREEEKKEKRKWAVLGYATITQEGGGEAGKGERGEEKEEGRRPTYRDFFVRFGSREKRDRGKKKKALSPF